MKFFFTHLRSVLKVLDDLGAVFFVNTATAFNLRNVDRGPTFLMTLRRVLWRAGAFIFVEYPSNIPFLRGPMRVPIYLSTGKLRLRWRRRAGNLRSRGNWLGHKCLHKPEHTDYSVDFSGCFAHALHPDGGTIVGRMKKTYAAIASNTKRRSHSHIYLFSHRISCVINPLNVTCRKRSSPRRITAHLRRGPERTTRSSVVGFLRMYCSAHSQFSSGTGGVS